MTKHLPLVFAIAVVGVAAALFGDQVFGQSVDDKPAQAQPADEPTKPVATTSAGADVLRALTDELARLRAQIADLRAGPAAPAPTADAQPAAPIIPDAAPVADAPAVCPPAPTTIVQRETVVERDVPVYVDRDVPVYVDRPVVVEQPTTVVVQDDCPPQDTSDVSLTFVFGDDDHRRDRGAYGGDFRGGSFDRRDRATTHAAPQRAAAPAPTFVRHEHPATAPVAVHEPAPRPRVHEQAPRPQVPAQPVTERVPFDPPTHVEHHDAAPPRRIEHVDPTPAPPPPPPPHHKK